MRKAVRQRFEKTTLAIGDLVVKWNYLEFVIDRLIWVLSGFDTYKECDIFLESVDCKQKAQIAKSLIVTRPIDEEWKELTISTLNRVANEFRIYRNETVHSRWFHDHKGPRRQRVKIRIGKAQSFSPLKITTIEDFRPHLGQMKRQNGEISKLASELEIMHSYAGVWRGNADGKKAVSYRRFLELVRSQTGFRKRPKR